MAEPCSSSSGFHYRACRIKQMGDGDGRRGSDGGDRRGGDSGDRRSGDSGDRRGGDSDDGGATVTTAATAAAAALRDRMK